MVEILVTLAILALMFGPLFALIQLSHKRTLRGGDKTIATVYAADIIELIRGGPYDAFLKEGAAEEKGLDLTTVFQRSNFFKGYDVSKYDSRFDVRVDVGPAGDLPRSHMKQVRVTVNWLDTQTKKVDTLKLVSYYSPANL
jgi:hypothetical protein